MLRSVPDKKEVLVEIDVPADIHYAVRAAIFGVMGVEPELDFGKPILIAENLRARVEQALSKFPVEFIEDQGRYKIRKRSASLGIATAGTTRDLGGGARVTEGPGGTITFTGLLRNDDVDDLYKVGHPRTSAPRWVRTPRRKK